MPRVGASRVAEGKKGMGKLSDLLSPLPLTDVEKTRQPVRAWQHKTPRRIVRAILGPIALSVIAAVITGVILAVILT